MKKLKLVAIMALLTSGASAVQTNTKDIFFDLHNVAITRDASTFIKGGVGNFGSTVHGWDKARLAGEFIGVLLRPAFYQGVWNLLHLPDNRGKCKVTEKYFDLIGDLGYPLLKKELIQFANNIFVENPKMIAVIAALKTEGHKVHLFSNIGPQTLKDAKDRNLFPNVLKQFDGNVINKTEITHWKPEAAAFEEALKNANTTAENAIMIDDKLNNLPTEAGITASRKKADKKGLAYTAPKAWSAGIVYNKKSHEAAVTELKQLELLPETFTQK